MGFVCSRRATLAALLLTAIGSGSATAQTPDSIYSYTGPILIENVTVVDGLGNAPRRGQDLYLADGKILRVGRHGTVTAPAGARRIDGAGATALPGLIDSHVHMDGNSGFAPPTADQAATARWMYRLLYAGVTTVFDIGSVLDEAVAVRDRVEAGTMAGPRFITAGTVFQGPNERTDSKLGVVNNHAETLALLEQHAAKKIPMVKAYLSMPPTRLGYLATEAHKRGMRLVVDASGFIGTSGYTLTGLDGYAHMPWHQPVIGESDMALMKERGTFVISTVGVVETVVPELNRFINHPEVVLRDPLMLGSYSQAEMDRWLDPKHVRAVVDGFNAAIRIGYGDWFLADWEKRPAWAANNTKRLIDYGVLTGLGTDAANIMGGFTTAGESMHYEMGLWVRSGIAPLRVIQAATSSNAKILKLEQVTGSITEGLAADLLLVKGDPTTDISATRNILQVINGGRIVNREMISRALTGH